MPSFAAEPGRTFGGAGESGSGKSVASPAVLGPHNPGGTKDSGRVLTGGRSCPIAVSRHGEERT
jgi:ABC-type glutathione transport system ATPase component